MAASLSTRRGSVSVSLPFPLRRPTQTGLEGELAAMNAIGSSDFRYVVQEQTYSPNRSGQYSADQKVS